MHTWVDIDCICNAAQSAAGEMVVVHVEPLQAQRLLQSVADSKASNVTDLQHSSRRMAAAAAAVSGSAC